MGDEQTETGMRLKQRRTRASLTSAARRLTASSGLNGFTVQELCDGVGVSRRTFFNYFPSKEDAVLGFESGVDEAHIATFMAAPAATHAADVADVAERVDAGKGAVDPVDTDASSADLGATRVSRRLMYDLAALAIAHFEALGPSRQDVAEFTAALRREPSLLGALMKSNDDEQARFVALVAEREGPHNQLIAEVAVALLAALIKLTAETFFADANTRPFDEILFERLAAAGTLFTEPAHTNRPQPRELVTTV